MREGGTRAHVLSTGEMLNVANVIDSPLCSQDVYALRGCDAPISPRAYDGPPQRASPAVIGRYDVRNLLIGAVRDETGRVTGLVELVNKGGSRAGFTHDDERMLAMLCSHCSIFLKSMQ